MDKDLNGLYFISLFLSRTNQQELLQYIQSLPYLSGYKTGCEWVNSSLTSHQQRGHTETGPRFKVSSERPEKRGIDLAIPGLVV